MGSMPAMAISLASPRLRLLPGRVLLLFFWNVYITWRFAAKLAEEDGPSRS